MADRAGAASPFEAGTKLFFLASMAGAIAFGAAFGARGWNSFSAICVIAFIAAVALGRILPDASLVVTLAVVYVVPALISELHGTYYWNFNPVWNAWNLGFLVARASVTRWQFPPRWRLPLVFWALIIATGWPLVVWREADFTLHLLTTELPPNSAAGGAPWFMASWVAGAALNWGMPLLWLDWLFGTFGAFDALRFRRFVLVPLGAGAVCACLVAAYQGLFDITWLNGGQWPSIGRAAGTFMDADAFGAFAGWWTVAFVAFAAAASAPRWFRVAGAIAFVAAWGGLWASGSRMALLGGLIGLALAAAEAFRVLWRLRSSKAARALFASTVVAGAVLVFFGARVEWTTASPVERALSSFRAVPASSLGEFVRETLWNRGAPYGTVSVQMVEESPVSGIGVGMFHPMFPDYAYVLRRRSTPDNAQSWYRHQLAETGLLGSIGWMVWLASFVVLLARGRPRPGMEAESRVVRGALVTIGLISAVSMPTQHFANAFTVVVFVFWYLTVIDTNSLATELVPASARTAARASVVVATVGFAAATLYMGWTHYRPAYRALMGDWNYAYGLYDPEIIDGREARWAEQHAVTVMTAPSRWMELTFWVNFGDVRAKPIDVKIWKDRNLAIRTRLRTTEPVVTYLRVPDGDGSVMLETETSRVVRPRDFGAADDRELGLALQWQFVDHPPAGATIAE